MFMDQFVFSNKSFIGKLLRFPLRFIPPATTMPILQGKLKGMKWIVGSGTHGCWLGSYEYKERVLFERIVTKASVFFDIGAHSGFYTLLASVLVGPGGKVFAFESLPENVKYLKKHLQLNGISNVTIIEAAVSDACGIGTFESGFDNYVGKISLGGSFQVRTVGLDELIDKAELPSPDYIKIDVEGAEFLVLSGAEQLLKKKHPAIFLSTHSEEMHQKVCGFLSGLNYKLQGIGAERLEETGSLFAKERALE